MCLGVILWPWPLIRWPWKFVLHQATCDQRLYKIWTKSSNLRLNYLYLFQLFAPIMPRCDLDLCPVDIELRVLCIFERNWIIHARDIDHLARFYCAILGVGHFSPTVFRGAWTQLHTKVGEDIGRSWLQFSVRIACCIFKRGHLKVQRLKTTPNFALFDPFPCEN